MSVEIEIVQRGLFKKPVSNNIIIGSLGFGVYNNNRLEDGQLGSEYIVFDNNRIGRGISVINEKNRVSLRMLNPTCSEEVDMFYNIAERIAALWNGSDIIQDGEMISPAEIPALRESIKDFNKNALNAFLEKEGVHTLFSARWELGLGDEEKAAIKAADDPMKAFGDWLHRLQSQDVYFAVPSFYQKDGAIMGVYAITEGADSVIPVEPSVPFGFSDGAGNPLNIDMWAAMLFCLDDEKTAGRVPYGEFIEQVRDGAKRYDGTKILIDGLSREKIKEILGNG